MAEAKDTIMKMLLSTPNPSQADIKAALKVKMDKTNIVNIGVSTGNNISIASTPIDVGTSKLCDYLERLNGIEEHVDLIYLDHCYTKPLNWRLENGYVKPTKTLFVTKPVEDVQCDDDDEIDVDGGNLNNLHPQPAYDSEKVTAAMNRIENHINILRQEAGEENWDILIDRTGWTLAQNRIFDRTVRILHQDRLARLAYKGSWNEPVLRRISVNKSARRLRTLFSTFAWQTKLLQWLHCTLIDIMDTHNLTAYIDILQTLKEKVPELVERIFFCSNLQANKTNPEAVKALIKKPWDPSSNGLTCHIPNRLPGNPLIVIVPSGSPNNTNSPKIQRWYNHFSHIGTVVVVSTTGLNKSTALTSLEHMMATTRVKLSELKSEYPGKNIVLVGFNTGAALACQVALLEPVMAVICLGFPLNTVDEKRGQPDDNLLALNVPVLFVIGQHAATSQVEDIEDLRERLRVENGLVIVGAADDCLRVNKSKQSTEGITQAMLDRCIVDEIAEFIATLLLSPKNLKIDLAKSRLKVIEKKRKMVGEDLLAKTKGGNLPLGTKRIKTSLPKGISRPNKFTGQIIAEGPKKSVIQKDFIMTPRQTILSGNIRRLTAEPRVDQQLKILPQYKILKKEDLVDSLNTESLLDQLTPDRLLEMPVIIQDDSMEMGN